MSNDDAGQSGSADREYQLGRLVIDVAIRLALIGGLVYWSLLLIGPFVIVVIWSAILTVALHPLYTWLAERLHSGRAAALAITLVGLAILLGPTAVLTASLIDTLTGLATGLRDGTLQVPPPFDGVQDWPIVGEQVFEFWSAAATNLSGLIAEHGNKLWSASGAALGSIAGLGGTVLLFAASMIVSGFLFAPGPSLAEGMRMFARRIAGQRGGDFVDMAGATIRNVSRGVIGISLAQAVLAGIGLVVAQIPAGGLIALLTLIFGIIQVGPGIVLLPTVIWVWTSYDTVPALLFTLYMVPVTFFDNALKPIVMAKGLKTPMLVIFIGVIGGTLAHGLIGLFLGPIVLAVFYELVTAWVRLGDAPADAPAVEGAKGQPEKAAAERS